MEHKLWKDSGRRKSQASEQKYMGYALIKNEYFYNFTPSIIFLLLYNGIGEQVIF